MHVVPSSPARSLSRLSLVSCLHVATAVVTIALFLSDGLLSHRLHSDLQTFQPVATTPNASAEQLSIHQRERSINNNVTTGPGRTLQVAGLAQPIPPDDSSSTAGNESLMKSIKSHVFPNRTVRFIVSTNITTVSAVTTNITAPSRVVAAVSHANCNDMKPTPIFTIGYAHHRPLAPFLGVSRSSSAESLSRADNVTRLTFMLYRIVRTHNISSIVDPVCEHSLPWLRPLLVRLEFEIPSFRHECLVSSLTTATRARTVLQGLSCARVVVINSTSVVIPKAQLALAWHFVGFQPAIAAWEMLQMMVRAGTSLVVMPNHPEVNRNPPGGHVDGRVNVRRAPYRFAKPMRVINDIGLRDGERKQMLLYQVEHLRHEAGTRDKEDDED